MTLFYISNCAVDPSGKPDPFLMQELPWLLSHFDRVVMIGHHGIRTLDGSEKAPFSVLRPPMGILRAWLEAPFQKEFWKELFHMRRKKQLTPINALKLLAFTQRGLQMHHWTEVMMRGTADSNATLYSCWMSFDGYAAALSKQKHPRARFVVRGHAFDIDTERNPINPFLMKSFIARQADGLYLISETAKAQYLSYMQGKADPDKVHVLAMGSGGQPVDGVSEAPMFTQGVLRVISCAMVIPIKQVDVLVEALAKWKGCPLCWTHIGGGEGLDELRTLADEKLGPKDNVIAELLGTMDAQRIQKLYDTRNFDVFVNTSRKEGVPISIMETMRHGTPVIAPRVGGIPELVTPDVGWLYDPAEGADGVLKALEALAALGREENLQMRRAAQQRWNEHYCSGALLPRLFPEQQKR